MSSWPSNLPNPTTTFNIAPVDQTIRTEMDVGAARVRRRTAYRTDLYTTCWYMSNDQVAIFRYWFDTTTANGGINGGASWFSINLPIASTQYTAVQARFKGPYTITHLVGTYWKIDGVLELRLT